MDKRSFLLSNLSGYSTLVELRGSSFFAAYREEIEALLVTPEVIRCPEASPRLTSFLRVVQWNIEKGKRTSGILECLRTDEVLKWADLILLNEADCGMARSGNSHVARCLAEALGMHMAFGPAHLELTKGTDDEREIPGENRESLQGNAVLSRYPILEAHIVPLPVCFQPYEFSEKRYGRRICLWALLDLGGDSLWAGTVHLEVRNTPRCRAAQMRHLVSRLPGRRSESYLLGGDLNSNGFSRGSTWRTLGSMWRIVRHSPRTLKELLCRPERGTEPLFRAARDAGFSWDGLNSGEYTASAPIGGLEEANMLPAFLVAAVRKRLEPYEGYLHFKLDWLLEKGIQALRERDVSDPAGVSSLDAGCGSTQTTGPGRLSDHIPIYADIRLQAGSPTRPAKSKDLGPVNE